MYPTRNQIVAAVYDALSESGTIELQTLYSIVKRRFSMTDLEIGLLDSQGKSQIEHDIRWALQTLKSDGRAINVRTGVWAVV